MAHPSERPGSRILRLLAALELWLVACGVAVSIAFPSVLPFAVLIGVLFWLVRWRSLGRISLRTPVDGSILVLGAMLGISTLLNTHTPETIPQVSRLLTGFILFYAVVNRAQHRSDIRWLTVGLVVLAFLLSIYALLGLSLTIDRVADLLPAMLKPFVTGMVEAVNPNVLAGNLAILFPIPVAVLLYWKGRHVRATRLFAVVSWLSVTALLIFTESRGAWLASLIAFAALVWMRWKWGWVSVMVGMLIVGVALISLDFTQVIGQTTSQGMLAGFENRFGIWQRALLIGKAFAFSGIGIGNFGRVADSLYPFFLVHPGSVTHTHNLYLQVLVDLGVPGLAAWLSLLFLVLFMSWKLYRRGKRTADDLLHGIGAGFFCSQLALIVHGLIDSISWTVARPAPIVWAIWGVMVSAYILGEKSKV